MDQNTWNWFMELHDGLPRQGPGSKRSTQKAWEHITNLPEQPRILDIGCGPGAQTLDLAELCNGHITALDYYPCFLEQLAVQIKAKDLSDRITIQQGDMHELPFDDAGFDVIWAEGSIYIMGFENGLLQWSRYLKPGGWIAVSEITWLQTDIPAEIKSYWEENYPGMTHIAGNVQRIKKCGYTPVAHFPLPVSDWQAEYNAPLVQNITAFEAKYQHNPQALQVAAIERQEIQYYEKYHDYYGYVFYIMQKPA